MKKYWMSRWNEKKKKQSETKKHFDFGVIHFAMLVRILLCKMIVLYE